MYFGGVEATATRQAIESAGLVVEEWQVVPEDEGDGMMVRFLWVLARMPQVRVGAADNGEEAALSAASGLGRRSLATR
jgi:hypothetical protein